jgi:hypothetical protein
MRARKPTCHSWRMVVPSQRRSCVQRTAQCLRSADLGHAIARRGLAWPGTAPISRCDGQPRALPRALAAANIGGSTT